jgi:hypothetical protein
LIAWDVLSTSWFSIVGGLAVIIFEKRKTYISNKLLTLPIYVIYINFKIVSELTFCDRFLQILNSFLKNCRFWPHTGAIFFQYVLRFLHKDSTNLITNTVSAKHVAFYCHIFNIKSRSK